MRRHPLLGDDGVATVEYAIVASLIAAVVVFVVVAVGTQVYTMFETALVGWG